MSSGENAELDRIPLDSDLLEKVLALVPHLQAVAQIGALARRLDLRFPVTSQEELMALFEGRRDRTFHGHSIRQSHVRRYLPDTFFPIEDEDQLLGRLLIAFNIRDRERFAAPGHSQGDS